MNDYNKRRYRWKKKYPKNNKGDNKKVVLKVEITIKEDNSKEIAVLKNEWAIIKYFFNKKHHIYYMERIC